MCTAGTCGLRIWATSEMPLAQKRGSSSAPGTCLARIPATNCPYTVETLTPTFSNTRPRMIDITPPPASSPSLAGRVPGRALEAGPAADPTADLNVRASISLEFGADAVAQLLEPGAGARFAILWRYAHAGKPPVWRSASPSTIAAAWATLSERRPGRMGISSRASAASCTSSGTPGAFPAHQQGVVGGKAKSV